MFYLPFTGNGQTFFQIILFEVSGRKGQVIFSPLLTRYGENDTTALNADLILLDLNSGEISTLAGSGNYSPPAELSPAWSPNGEWLAYRRGSDTNGDGSFNASKDRSDLWLIQPNGSNAHPIIVNSYNVASIAWSPNSQNIIFATQDYRILICDLQGQIILDLGGSDYLHPACSP